MRKISFTDLPSFLVAIVNCPNAVLAEGVGENIIIICLLLEFTVGTSSLFTE